MLQVAHAQRWKAKKYHNLGSDIGVSVGLSKYLGEIGEDDLLYSPEAFRASRISLAGHYRYQFHEYFAVRAMAGYTRLTGADSTSDDPNRFTRNLSFVNDVIEATVDFQFVLNFNQAFYGRMRVDRKAYAFIGAGVFSNNPKARLDATDPWTNLRDLNTEGPGNSYGQWQAAIPFGFGVDYIFARRHRIGVYFSYRITFTDYIDDISGFYPSVEDLSEEAIPFSNRTPEVINTPQAQTATDGGVPLHVYYKEGGVRGNPETNDYFFTFGITYSVFTPKSSRF